MFPLLNLFIDICLFRRGPQDVPESLWLMYACIGASLLLSTLANWFAWQPGQPFGGFLVTLALLLWLVIALLRWRGQMNRLKQTMTALFGADAVMTLIDLPLALYRFPTQPEDMTQTDVLMAFLQLGLLAWSLLIIAHILRYALNLPLTITSLISAAWFMAAVAIYGALNGAPTT